MIPTKPYCRRSDSQQFQQHRNGHAAFSRQTLEALILVAKVIVHISACIKRIGPGRADRHHSADLMSCLGRITSDGVVKLQSACCSRRDQRAILEDRFPLRAGGALVKVLARIIMGNDLNFSVQHPKATSPLPDISVEVTDTRVAAIVIPGHWPAASGCPTVPGDPAALMGCGVVSTIVIIAPRHKAVFKAPQCDPRILGIRHKMPSPAFRLAAQLGLVKIDVYLGVFEGQAIGPVMHHNILVFGDKDLRKLQIVNHKHRVRRIRSALQHAQAGKLRNAYHDRRKALSAGTQVIIEKHRVFSPGKGLHRQLQIVKATHRLLLPRRSYCPPLRDDPTG